MDTRREMNETTGFHLKFRNSEAVDVYDIEVNCSNIAEIGTVLGGHRHTYYITIKPGDVRNVDLVLPDKEQQTGISCRISSYQCGRG